MTKHLMESIYANDVAELRRILASGENLNDIRTNDGKWNLLYYAVFWNRYECAELIIKAGVDINFQEGNNSLTPLYCAVFQDDIRMINMLIKYGANLEIANGLMYTPLHCAALHDRLDVVSILINAGANLNVKTHDERLPRQMIDDVNKPQFDKIVRCYRVSQSRKMLARIISCKNIDIGTLWTIVKNIC